MWSRKILREKFTFKIKIFGEHQSQQNINAFAINCRVNPVSIRVKKYLFGFCGK